MEVFLIETNDPEGPYGAKEAGQGPLLPIMPAVANALYNAVGVRVDEIPVAPEKVFRGLQALSAGKDGRVGPTKVPDVEFPEPIRVDPPDVLPYPN